MKMLALILAGCLLLSLCVGCEQKTPAETKAPITTTALMQTPTEAPTEEPTEAPTEAPTEPPVVGPQPTDLVGTWQRTHTEVEGDRNANTKATLTVTEGEMTVTYKDKEFPDDNFKNKALTVKEGELYPDCGNDSWYAEVSSTGKYQYCLTLLPDGTLLMHCGFEIDGMPMVSYQWFARAE